MFALWQYGLWSFQTGGTKLERNLPKNQHTQRKLLNFENWVSGEVSKSAKSPNLLTFKVNFLYQQDSKELSPRSLDKMLLKLQVNSQNVQNTQLSKFFKFSRSSKFLQYSKFNSVNTIWIVTIHVILEHVWTCWNTSKLV